MAEPKPICIVCNRRVASRLGHKACRLCANRTEFEGTRKIFGLPEPRKSEKQRINMFVKAYNKLALEGKSVKEIAAKLGLKVSTIKNKSGLLRGMGLPLQPLVRRGSRAKPPGEPLERPNGRVTSRTNEHGGGKCGVTGCECLPCQKVRRANRNAWNAANRERIESYQDRYAEKKAKPS